MDMRIETKSWKMITPDEGQKTIGGSFVVKCGKETVADRSFNDGYGNMKITFPATILAKLEAIDKEIRQVIIETFTGKKE